MTMLEAAATLIAEAAILAFLMGALTAGIGLASAIDQQTNGLHAVARSEQVLEASTSRSRAVTTLALAENEILLGADLDDSGVIASRGHERIGLRIANPAGLGGPAYLMQTVGRQAMTASAPLPGPSSLSTRDSNGAFTTDPQTVVIVLLYIGERRLVAGVGG